MLREIEAADGTDHLYEKHDRNWRVRVRIHTEIASDAPINGDHEVEAAGVGLVISVALLDDAGEVAKAPNGKLRIFPPHVLTIPASAFGRVDPAEQIETIVQKQLDDAERQLKGKDELHTVLARYAKK